MIGLTGRPPQLETPFSVFDESAITPNDAFFVRYHLAGIPLEYRSRHVHHRDQGQGRQALEAVAAGAQADRRRVEIVAVNQCSGNSRGFFDPRVAGGQLGNGAMGNARWRGVPLKAVLDKAGVQPARKQVTFNGMDGPSATRPRTSSRRSTSTMRATAR